METYNDWLAHYGILGQKWGVRRYQNFDGKYTKKGLERYFKAKEKYDSANEKYKQKKKNGEPAQSAKATRKEAKRKMNKEYADLKNMKRIDQGRNLVRKGKNIGSNNIEEAGVKLGASLALMGGSYAISKYVPAGKWHVTKYLPAIDLQKTSTIALGTAAVGTMLGSTVKTRSENRKIRAYYNRSKYRDNT